MPCYDKMYRGLDAFRCMQEKNKGPCWTAPDQCWKCRKPAGKCHHLRVKWKKVKTPCCFPKWIQNDL